MYHYVLVSWVLRLTLLAFVCVLFTGKGLDM